jgi:hypothetical protein
MAVAAGAGPERQRDGGGDEQAADGAAARLRRVVRENWPRISRFDPCHCLPALKIVSSVSECLA